MNELCQAASFLDLFGIGLTIILLFAAGYAIGHADKKAKRNQVYIDDQNDKALDQAWATQIMAEMRLMQEEIDVRDEQIRELRVANKDMAQRLSIMGQGISCKQVP
jgi:hypothetical protein